MTFMPFSDAGRKVAMVRTPAIVCVWLFPEIVVATHCVVPNVPIDLICCFIEELPVAALVSAVQSSGNFGATGKLTKLIIDRVSIVNNSLHFGGSVHQINKFSQFAIEIALLLSH
jgi:hypothetical protein